ncbi:MAG: DUF192 domain-containing protein [Candidatus Levybacteria bacterium]|nr:DUF192 domain-containing protein [Candidatus Levybacteria bacterium]
MKQILGLFALLIIIVIGIVLAQNYIKTKSFFPFEKNPSAAINGKTFQLKVAKSQEEKEIGLSKTESLSENQGMIFLFDDPGYYSFWMKDMKFSIDIIFINKDNVVEISENAQPQTESTSNLKIYTPIEPIDKVLEIKSGLSKKNNIKKGDKIQIKNL